MKNKHVKQITTLARAHGELVAVSSLVGTVVAPNPKERSKLVKKEVNSVLKYVVKRYGKVSMKKVNRQVTKHASGLVTFNQGLEGIQTEILARVEFRVKRHYQKAVQLAEESQSPVVTPDAAR